MTNELTVKPQQFLSTFDDVERAAKAMAASGFFADSRSAAQAVVKILAGQELGFGAFASMTGVYIIQGRPSISANLMASAVKRSGRYNYRVIEMTDDVCEIAFFEGGQEAGRSKFTKEDATKADTKNMGKFPRNMLFARAMSNGVRWFCPDVCNGNAVYTPEELGATVNEDGQVIEAEVKPAPAKPGLTRGEAEVLTDRTFDEYPEPVKPMREEEERASWPVSEVMTLDQARAFQTSTGVSYGDMDRPGLSAMSGQIQKKLHGKLNADEQDAYLLKLQAIKVILSQPE